jgi:hypothetical protein
MKGACSNSLCGLLGDIFLLCERLEAVGPGVRSGTTRRSWERQERSTSLSVAVIEQFPELTFEEVTAS